MAAPELTYDAYSAEDGWRGRLSQDRFLDALPRARARLVAITGEGFDADLWGAQWTDALCAMVDHVAGADGSHAGVTSETVGDTTVDYADWVAGQGDVDAVAPYLAGTPLLYQGVGWA